MKISIFTEAKAHPCSKAEKVLESKKTSAPYLPQVVEVPNEDKLIELVTTYAWSPATFDGVRKASNFKSLDFLVYDIDEGLTIEQAAELLDKHDFCWLILPSPSHTEDNNRFRVIIPLAFSITDEESFELTWEKGAEILGAVDPQASDCCRFYFGSTDKGWGCWDFGKDLFEPIKKIAPKTAGYVPSQHTRITVTEDMKEMVKRIYGVDRDWVPEAVDYFLKNASTGLKGNWISSLNSFVFSLSLSGIDDTIIWELCEQLAPDELDSRDTYQIRKAIADGKKHSEI
jgi:hypothetical protein